MSSTYRSQTPQSLRQPASSSTAADGPTSSSSGTGKAAGSPFISNPHSHPSFNPVKTGTKGSGDSKTPKQPKAPDKPLMPYMRYSRKVSRLVWDQVKASNPDLKLWEIGKIIGQMWRELSDDEKQEYLDEYDADKLQYTEAMKAYHNSPAYQSWLSAKGKVDQEADTEEPEKTRRSKAPAASSSGGAEGRSIAIQPCEDDDEGDESYSIKNVAAARFHRNHCLINEIFSDLVVPDVRTLINENRLAVLKRQVMSLTMHQKKLEAELEVIEQKHGGKKTLFSNNSDSFYDDLNKVDVKLLLAAGWGAGINSFNPNYALKRRTHSLCNDKPQISEDQFSTMVSKAKDELREKQRLALMSQQQPLNTDTTSKSQESNGVNGEEKMNEEDGVNDKSVVMETEPVQSTATAEKVPEDSGTLAEQSVVTAEKECDKVKTEEENSANKNPAKSTSADKEEPETSQAGSSNGTDAKTATKRKNDVTSETVPAKVQKTDSDIKG